MSTYTRIIMNRTRYFSAPSLLAPPVQRAAFSDRTAYVCAELSRLAYFPFEGGSTLDRLMAQVDKALAREDVEPATARAVRDRLAAQLSQDRLDGTLSRQIFAETLQEAGFELTGTFGEGDTQGFVCRQNMEGSKGVAYLVYRGTESIQDALDDCNAFLTREPFEGTDDQNSRVHSGFYSQFRDADEQVRSLLNQVSGQQLIITGHSLGGALAVLATRFYAFNSSGACYTFGAPAVGNPEFQQPIKTPIYRIVNEVDPVARVPSAYTGYMVQFLYHWLYKLLALFGIKRSRLADQLIADLKLYRQNGYGSCLIRRHQDIALRTLGSLDSWDRFRLWRSKFHGKGMLLRVGEYHKIDHYVDRLKHWATSRNLDNSGAYATLDRQQYSTNFQKDLTGEHER